MQIGAVDFPEPLLAAQRKGCLVVFAGAGVSVALPSNCPDLNSLARKIAEGAPIQREQGEPIDRFLGRLKYQGVPVHQRVREALIRPSSMPTRLHYDLLKLFPSPAEVRLVTTNFDAHFTRAAAESHWQDVEIFYAPALPLGHQLSGIVYLHGNVEKDPDRIVLTDDDFGRAYLTEGWATRFLQSIFANYTVLFVGYSHNDPVMNYLSRGLPPEVRDLQKGRAVWRFALTPEESASRWEFLDITPISYPMVTARNRHAALGQSIGAWVKLSRMGSLDHQHRIRQLVAKGLPIDRQEADYLAAVLKEADTARVFTRYARSLAWLGWAEGQGLFHRLFQPGDVDEVATEVADWYAREFVIRHPEESLALIRRKGRPMNPALWEAIARRSQFSKSREGAEIFARWIAVLVPSASIPSQTELLTRLLESCRYPGDRTAALLLFERLTRPRLDLGPAGPTVEEGKGRPTRDRLALEGDVERLRAIWSCLFRPHLEDFAEPLMPIVAGQLQQVRLLSAAMGEVDAQDVRRQGVEGRDRAPVVRRDVDFLSELAGELLRWASEAGRGAEKRAA